MYVRTNGPTKQSKLKNKPGLSLHDGSTCNDSPAKYVTPRNASLTSLIKAVVIQLEMNMCGLQRYNVVS
jgi:hypothetical protein